MNQHKPTSLPRTEQHQFERDESRDVGSSGRDDETAMLPTNGGETVGSRKMPIENSKYVTLVGLLSGACLEPECHDSSSQDKIFFLTHVYLLSPRTWRRLLRCHAAGGYEEFTRNHHVVSLFTSFTRTISTPLVGAGWRYFSWHPFLMMIGA